MKYRVLVSCACLLFLCACGGASSVRKDANAVFAEVKGELALLTKAAEEMKAFGAERIYVALEKESPEETEEEPDALAEEDETAPSANAPDGEERLVYYLKASGPRTEIESEVLEDVLRKFGLALLLFQTASDSRESVLFSYALENGKEAVKNGFYYSFDAAPCGWWGRRASLKKNKTRYVQIARDGTAWYYTSNIEGNFFYFEKCGDLVA